MTIHAEDVGNIINLAKEHDITLKKGETINLVNLVTGELVAQHEVSSDIGEESINGVKINTFKFVSDKDEFNAGRKVDYKINLTNTLNKSVTENLTLTKIRDVNEVDILEDSGTLPAGGSIVTTNSISFTSNDIPSVYLKLSTDSDSSRTRKVDIVEPNFEVLSIRGSSFGGSSYTALYDGSRDGYPKIYDDKNQTRFTVEDAGVKDTYSDTIDINIPRFFSPDNITVNNFDLTVEGKSLNVSPSVDYGSISILRPDDYVDDSEDGSDINDGELGSGTLDVNMTYKDGKTLDFSHNIEFIDPSFPDNPDLTVIDGNFSAGETITVKRSWDPEFGDPTFVKFWFDDYDGPSIGSSTDPVYMGNVSDSSVTFTFEVPSDWPEDAGEGRAMYEIAGKEGASMAGFT